LKKLSVLFVILCLLFAVSCAESDSAESFDAEFGTESEIVDFNGLALTVMKDEHVTGLFGYKEDTQLYDELASRISTIEKKYNTKIEYATRTDPVNALPQKLAAGETDINVLFMRSHNLRQLGNAGYLADVALYSDIIDYKNSFLWGSYNTLELLTCNGVLCGVTPASWIDNLTPYYFAIVANNNLFMKNGFANPREYIENDTWGREIFEEVTVNCTDTANQIYGFETAASFIYRLAVHTNGVPTVDYSTGSPRSGYHTEAAAEALQWASDYITRNRENIAFTGESNQNFKAGNAAMTTKDAVSICKEIAYEEAVGEFSVLPFPAGPFAEKGQYGGFISTTLNTVSIPVSSEYIEESAMVINEIFAPMNGINTLEDLKQYYATNVLYSYEDVDMLFKLCDSAEWCYWVENGVSHIDKITTALENGSMSVSQAIESFAPLADEVINEYIIPNKEGLASYFD